MLARLGAAAVVCSILLGPQSDTAGRIGPGTPIRREIAPHETQSYIVQVGAGQVARLAVAQRAIDLDGRVTDSGGRVVFDAAYLDRAERLVFEWIADAAGAYRIDLTLRSGHEPETYGLSLDVRSTREDDRRRIAAEQLSAQAQRQRAQGTSDSLKASVATFEKAIAAWRAIGTGDELARALRGLAAVRRTLGAPREAITLLTEAASLQTDDVRQRLLTWHGLGLAYFIAGDSHRALEMFTQALAAEREVNDRQNESKTLNSMGTVLNNLGEMHDALEAYQQALQVTDVDDETQRASVVSNLGVAYSNVGDVPKATEHLTRALEIRRSLGDARGQAATLYTLGNLTLETGEPQRALAYLTESLTLRRRTGDRPGEAFTLQAIGSCYDTLGDSRLALDYFDQARVIRHEMGNRNDEADTLMHLSATYGRLEQRTPAIADGEAALRLMQAAGNHRGEGEALESLGALFLSFGDPRKALDFFERARPLVHQANDIHVEARADGGIAAAEIDLGRSREAADELQQALALAHQAADRVEEVELDYQLARADIRLGDLAAARDQLDNAIAVAETVRSHVAGPDLRAHYFATVRKAHELLIDTLMRLADVAPGHGFSAAAFEAAERARSRSLLELLQESHADVRAGVDPDLLAREQSLETALSAKARAMVRAGGQSPRDLEMAQRELDELAAAFRAIEADIRVKSPAYAALTQPTTVTIADVQHRLLDADTLLLEYAIGDDRSYVWAITRDGVEVRPLPARSAVEAAVRRVYTLASTNDPTSGAAAERALRRAGDLLLGRITIQPSIRRVAVVADGPLEYLPFSALRLRTGRSVLQRCEVVMLPSVSTLAELRRARDQHRPAERIAAAFADPVFDAADPRVSAPPMVSSAAPTIVETPPVRRGPDVQRAAEDVGLVHFERLPGTRQEADAIRSLLPASARLIALDFDATRDALLDPALADYRIIHIATHGLINSRHPELSGLVLSLVDRDGHARDGFVPSDELYKLRLGADLVVLSACRTALGEQIRGEGLVSLTRPFMYAGVPRIVATLWQVPDRPTAVLMTHLYRGLLRNHLSPAAALRSAQLFLQRTPRWSAPYYWAAFTLEGDWR